MAARLVPTASSRRAQNRRIIALGRFADMPSTSNTAENLRRVFYDSFAARDLAEPLASFDYTTATAEVKAFMIARPLVVVGIRREGVVYGVLEQSRVDDRPTAEQLTLLSDVSIVTTTSSLPEVVAALDKAAFVLVEALGQPVGVIVRADLEKPPMRMWLFGMVTLLEMSITRILTVRYPHDSWTDQLAASRVEKAQELQAERLRRKEVVELMDCLQLSDKGQLLVKDDELRSKYWNRPKRQILKVIKEVEALRNNLAHSQSFIGQNWDSILRMPDALDGLLSLPVEVTGPSSLEPH